MSTVDVNGITINYRVEGNNSGPWLVLINGLADDLETWSTQIPAFTTAGYRVVSYDNRGIGGTSAPQGPYTAELLADDLHALLTHLEIGDFHLLGVSMGGMIAQAYAIKYPNGPPSIDGVQKGIISISLCCTYAQPTRFCERMFKLWADMAQHMSVRDVMRDVTLWAFTVPFFRTRQKELEEVEKAMEELDMSVEAYLAQLNVIQVFDTTKELDKIKQEKKILGGVAPGRVAVLAGEQDVLIPVQLSRELADSVIAAQFMTTPGGHACMWEFPDEFNKIVLEFLGAR